MKMKLFTLLTLIVIGVVSQGFAAEGNNASISAKDAVTKMVKAKIQYPSFLKSDGVAKAQVLVEFKVNEDGSLNIINTNQTDERVKNYVINKMENIQIQNADYEEGEVYVLKLDFRLL